MADNEIAKITGLANLHKVCESTLPKTHFNKVNDTYWGLLDAILFGKENEAPKTGAWAVNQLLVNVYENTSKKHFKKALQNWDSNLIEGHEGEILNGTPITTIRNYHEYLRKIGYINGEDIQVTEYGRGFKVEMVTGCPYTPFCETTDNVRCVRKVNLEPIIRQIPGGTEYLFRLERPERIPGLQETPGNNCVIKGIHHLDASEEMYKSKEEKSELVML